MGGEKMILNARRKYFWRENRECRYLRWKVDIFREEEMRCGSEFKDRSDVDRSAT